MTIEYYSTSSLAFKPMVTRAISIKLSNDIRQEEIR